MSDGWQVVAYNTDNKKITILADSYDGKRFNAFNDLVIDADGGIYFTDPLFEHPIPCLQGIQAVYYISTSGKVTRVTDHIAAFNGIALSPDGKRLYVAPSHQAEMLVFDVLSKARALAKNVHLHAHTT